MEESFYEAATARDIDLADIFFCELYIDPHEPAQTYTTWDELTGAWKEEHILAGSKLARICSDNVQVNAPSIKSYDPKNPTADMVDYERYPVSIQLPTTGTDKIEVVQFTIDNVDRTFVDILRRLHYPLRVNIARGFVRDRSASAHGHQDVDPNPQSRLVDKGMGLCTALEQRLLDLVLQDVKSTPQTITGKLVVDTILWKKYPNNHEVYEHYNFPGLWGLDDDDMREDPEFDPDVPLPPVDPHPPPGAHYDYDIDISDSGRVSGHIGAGESKIFRFVLSNIPGDLFIMFRAQTYVINGPCFILSLEGHPTYTTAASGCNFTGTGYQNSDVIASKYYYGGTWLVNKGEYLYLKVFNEQSAGDYFVDWRGEKPIIAS